VSLWRAGRTAYANPWWFDDSPLGRFNPTGSGQGTCYLGFDELAGLLEVLGTEMAGGTVHFDELAIRSVFALDGSIPQPIADLASRRAAGFGVSNALSSMTPYDVPQEWARAFVKFKFQGIRYRTRFDTGPRPRGVAVFGKPGSNTRRWRVARQVPAAQFEEALLHRCNIKVMRTPDLSALPSAPDP
jgi:hypothetical protein